MALREGRAPLAELTQDLHLLEIIEAAERATRERKAVPVVSRFDPLDLRPEARQVTRGHHHIHDHTRPADEQ
jgi:hypothetical protein